MSHLLGETVAGSHDVCFTVWFSDDPDPEGQGFCQAGFSVDFTKVTIAPAICTLL